MVRRRASKSGPKAKGKPRPVDRKDSKINRWNTADDIPLDEEDQFHASRDEILLDGDRYGIPDDDEDVEEEVFALKGIPADSDSDDEDEDAEMDDEEDLDEEDDALDLPSPKKSSKSKTAPKSKSQPGFASDEDEEGDEEEEYESWGRSKAAYYSSNAAELDSEDEEAHELEEQEAKRLQAKARENMTDADFGLGDIVEDPDAMDEVSGDFLEPVAEVVVEPALQDKKSILRNVEKTNPETLALAYDWEDTAQKLVRSQQKLKRLELEQPDALSIGMVHLHYQTLLTYATTLAFYLHLRTLPKYTSQPLLLRAHPIFSRLLQLKQALSTLEELDFDLSSDSDVDSEEGDSEDDDYEDMNLDIEEDMAALKRLQAEEEGEEEESTTGYGGMERVLRLNAAAGGKGKKGKKGKGKGSPTKVDFNELARLLEEAEQGLPDRLRPNPQVKTKVKVNKQSDADVVEPPAKKRKTSKTKATPAPTFDLVEPEFVSSRPSSSKANSTSTINDSYGDQTALTSTDIADKSSRRHTLRFHTSKIESSAARRSGARAALGGDDDVPYRERRKEKDIKERKEREKRKAGGKLGMGGDDLDDEDPETKETKSKTRGAEENDEGEGDTDMLDGEGYYELVSKARKEKKEKKKKEHDEEKFASRPDVDVVPSDESGPRSLTRAILKNRGLTPHRSKSVRNPRVKKRQRYDKAQKKLASQRAVYKGGIGDASKYAGEQSGISKVVKSVRFGE